MVTPTGRCTAGEAETLESHSGGDGTMYAVTVSPYVLTTLLRHHNTLLSTAPSVLGVYRHMPQHVCM